MNRSIEQALLSLLPTHNSTLPQPLTELASSLLAQSRHRASTLKAEEEIARPYACAHIACDRLKITLNLPPIDPRPPIPPRIYKRLYNHLENILPSSSSTPGRATPGGRATQTPSSRLRTNDINESPTARKGATSAKASPLPSRGTPGKAKSLAELRGTPAKAVGRKLTSSEALPPWMRQTVRLLCKEHGHEKIGPVIMSGMESIVAPNGVMTSDAWVKGNLVPLLGAIYLLVWRGFMWPKRDIDEKKYTKFRKQLVTALNKAPKTVVVSTATGTTASSAGTPSKRKRADVDAEDASWKGWKTVTTEDLDDAAMVINRHGWLELDWAKGVEDLMAQVLDGEEGEEELVDEELSIQGPLNIRRPDTMLQDGYDYLSERKLKDYEVWKKGILARIKELKRMPPPTDDGLGKHIRTAAQLAGDKLAKRTEVADHVDEMEVYSSDPDDEDLENGSPVSDVSALGELEHASGSSELGSSSGSSSDSNDSGDSDSD
ncbi:Origin recognition complex subunit 6 (ORC6) domain containing protein [Rhypophila decipiens]